MTYNRYTITAALPYANGPLHIGHIAGAYLPADIYTRYLRLRNKDVAFICGSDEHGAAITIRAKKEGVTPQQIIDKYHEQMKTTFENFGIAFDIYHRTSSPLHHKTAQDFFLQLNNTNKFQLIESEQFFDETAKQFLADRYIIGTCPKCGHDSAYGDQCEKCGSTLSPTELINPKSTLSGSVPVMKKTTHWYLPLNEYEAWLRTWLLEGKKDVLKANVFGQCRSWLEQGLQARAMTRDLDWGVKVPLNTPEAAGKVLYVWLDAPIGYISATKAWAAANGKHWEDYWKKEDTKLVHFIGKDNIVFHCIIFPIMLKAHGDFILPDNIPANEFLNLEGDKISTSRNWAVWLHEYLQDFPNRQDALRYVLTSIAPETKDSEFTWKDFQTRNNSELANILGNFVHRTLTLVNMNFNGDVPARGELTLYDQQVLSNLKDFPKKIESLLENYKFRDAQFELMNLARLGNTYLSDTEPWKLIKADKEAAGTVLNIALQITASLAILSQPFLPFAAQKLIEMLGNGQTSDAIPAHLHKDEKPFIWENAGKPDVMKSYYKIGNQIDVLFSKIEDEAIEKQLAKLEASKTANKQATPIKENITFENFAAMDIRVATIVAAEKVAKTKKLLKLTLDTGLDTRTVVSGIAEYYEPEKIIGQQVLLLANLAPREMKGIISQGMILMAQDKDGSLKFVQPNEKVANGITVA
jgi:methionyl-tRNA synthetase